MSATSFVTSSTPISVFPSGSSGFVAFSFFAATLAKLRVGRTLGANVGTVMLGLGDAGTDAPGGGVLARLSGLRSDAAREFVRDIVILSLITSRSFSRRSATSFSRDVTSTGLYRMSESNIHGYLQNVYLAAPKGLALAATATGGVGPILGEDKGLGVAETGPERGRSSNFRRFSCGVGGVELVAVPPEG